jgi:beta-lactamase regulating signal transducer with metallopeptidase domain
MFETLISSRPVGQATAWLLTYALHSTLFLGLAWLASRRLARWARLEEAVWRFALVAALATATLQLAAGWEPLAGRWSLEVPGPVASAVDTAVESPATVLRTAEPLRALPMVPAAPLRALPVQEAAPVLRIDLRSAVLGLWACGALLLALGWGWSYLRLRRHLRARPEVIGGGMFSLLVRMTGELGLAPLVRLTCSSRVSVPVALGLRRPEICVPPRAISHLEPEQQEGMLAHELAHLVRRDPFWLAFGRLLTSVLFFQPLNWVACRRLRELSERLCDEWAVERTGRPLSLARCLAEVAGWSVRPLRELPVPSMADRPSSLARRIRHLLDDARSPERRVRPVWLAVSMLAVLVGVAAVAPGVYAASKEPVPAEPALAASAVEPADPADPAEPVLAEEPASEIDAEIDADLERELDRLADDMSSLEVDLGGLDDLGDLAKLGDLHLEKLAALADVGHGGELSEAEQREIEEMAERAARDAAEISEKYAKDYAALAEEMSNRMEPELERISEEVNAKLAPEIERISEEVNRNLSPEIERISEEVAERMSKLGPEMERLHAEAERLRQEGKLNDTERERIRSEARELARRARPSVEELQAMREAQRKYRDDVRKVMEEHREEIEAARREARLQADAMREQMRRQLEADPKYRELRERHRQEMEQIRERHREEMRQQRERMRQDREKEKQKENVKEKEKVPA